MLSNKRVLICSLTRPFERVTKKYLEQLSADIPFYKKRGVDEIYLLNSSNGLFVLPFYKNYFPEIATVAETDFKFTTYLKTVQGKKQDVDFLSKFWNYQALFNDGKLESFVESTLDNPIKSALTGPHAGYFKEKNKTHFLKESDKLIWRPSFLLSNWEDDLGYRAIYYQNIWPNEQLKQYLLDLPSQRLYTSNIE